MNNNIIMKRLKGINLSCMISHFRQVRLFATPWTIARQAPLSMGFSSKNTRVGCHFLLQGIFPIQGWKLHLLCLLHWWWVLLEW